MLIASYFFYACWDYRFLFLLIFSTLLDFFTGKKISESDNTKSRKFWFWLSIIVNLGFLGVFKYYNFFAESFANALGLVGIQTNYFVLNVVLPVGISFYTFHGLSYIIDIYNQKIKAENNFIDYALFVSFFPLLVAGPIERATHLLPQIKMVRNFDAGRAVDGLRQILWGLFKKVVIADSCADFADMVFDQQGEFGGSAHLLGALFFTFQIYCDFSGYSDIALGTARLFGFELMRNFAFPYFSRDIAEFWRRWHISLSSWFKDYLYIPLGGSIGGTWMKLRNTFIIFLVSGFWHGANWTFVLWGFLNALYFLPLLLSKRNRNHIGTVAMGRSLPTLKEFVQMFLTFTLTVLAWIFFRANTVGDAFQYISAIFSKSLFSIPNFPDLKEVGLTLLLIFGFLLVEWVGRHKEYALADFAISWKRAFRWGFYYFLVFMIFIFFGKEQTFIYFQF